MNALKNKSDINLEAAELLHKNSLYPSVIHCAYYSCFQYMKFIWIEEMGKSELDLSNLIRNSTEGSHEVLINQIGVFLKNKGCDFRDFNNKIGQLKKLRRRADYEDFQIDSMNSGHSLTLSKILLKVLKNCA